MKKEIDLTIHVISYLKYEYASAYPCDAEMKLRLVNSSVRAL